MLVSDINTSFGAYMHGMTLLPTIPCDKRSVISSHIDKIFKLIKVGDIIYFFRSQTLCTFFIGVPKTAIVGVFNLRSGKDRSRLSSRNIKSQSTISSFGMELNIL